jgi:hypothetical protein
MTLRQVIPGANRSRYLVVDEVVDKVRFLIRLGGNVKFGPQVLVRTMRHPMTDWQSLPGTCALT